MRYHSCTEAWFRLGGVCSALTSLIWHRVRRDRWNGSEGASGAIYATLGASALLPLSTLIETTLSIRVLGLNVASIDHLPLLFSTITCMGIHRRNLCCESRSSEISLEDGRLGLKRHSTICTEVFSPQIREQIRPHMLEDS